MKTQNIEKKLTAGGKDTPKLNMEKFIQLADKDKIGRASCRERV